jgi:hypothetical protein
MKLEIICLYEVSSSSKRNSNGVWINFVDNVYDIEKEKIYVSYPSKLTLFLFS